MNRAVLPAAMGLVTGVMLTVTVTMPGSGRDSALTDAQEKIRQLHRQLSLQQRQLKVSGDLGLAVDADSVKPTALATVIQTRTWTDTPDHRRLHELLKKVANSQGEVMVALANDVMMCSNRKTCWWNGGNVLDTFLKSVIRLKVTNVVIITLDDETEAFCNRFPTVSSLRLDLPVPKAQQGSRGANMISTLKYSLLRQALLMGFSVLVVDLDLVFLKVR